MLALLMYSCYYRIISEATIQFQPLMHIHQNEARVLPMAFKQAEFVISAAHKSQFLKRPIPHFVFSGRSNVGKSSLINKILNRKSLAKTSTTPGKTRLVNYFLIDDRFYFVDIPGYGYAKVSKSERERWRVLIESYLTETPYLAMIYQLVDIRHDPSPQDHQMLEWLRHVGLAHHVILTKADKLSKNKAFQQSRKIAKQLGLDHQQVITTSASNGVGIAELRNQVLALHKQTIVQITNAKDVT